MWTNFFVIRFATRARCALLTDGLDARRVKVPSGRCWWICTPRPRLTRQPLPQGQDPLECLLVRCSELHALTRNPTYGNLLDPRRAAVRGWFFPTILAVAPALNKIPLGKWTCAIPTLSSTTCVAAARLELVYGTKWGRKKHQVAFSCKFLHTFVDKSRRRAFVPPH